MRKFTLILVLLLATTSQTSFCMFRIRGALDKRKKTDSDTRRRKHSLIRAFDSARRQKEKTHRGTRALLEIIEEEKQEIEVTIEKIHKKSETLNEVDGRSESERSIADLKKQYFFSFFSQKVELMKMNSGTYEARIEQILGKDIEHLAKDETSTERTKNQINELCKALEQINQSLTKIIEPFLNFKKKLTWAKEILDEEIKKIKATQKKETLKKTAVYLGIGAGIALTGAAVVGIVRLLSSQDDEQT